MSRRYRKAARWGLAIGLPGQAPSRQARTLASTAHMGDLPSGVWHTSDHAVAMLAAAPPVVSDAVQVETGARFRLLSLPDGPILSLCPLDGEAHRLIAAAWDDPYGWANGESWRIDP